MNAFPHFRMSQWGVGTKLLAFSIPPILLVVFLTTWGVYTRSAANLEQKLTSRAKAIHTQIRADREYYASVVVPRILALGGTLSSHYHDVTGTLPLPATFVREASEIASAQRAGYTAQVISPWAINKDRGLSDNFHHEAFSTLSMDPEAYVARIDTIEGQSVMRIVMGDIASAQSCVDCHNAHPESPRHDFKLHDLMGGLEVIMPIEQYLQESRHDLFLTAAGGLTLFLLLVGILASGSKTIITHPLESARLAHARFHKH